MGGRRRAAASGDDRFSMKIKMAGHPERAIFARETDDRFSFLQ